MALNGNSMKRGALIVLEGCDRAGKTTQCKKLAQVLTENGHKAMYMNFPDRSTLVGGLINSYLTNKNDFSDEGIHLLFTLNRWEAKSKMEKLLKEGISLIVDRYSYSGVAFSAAKGVGLEWCKSPERGLLKPDLVLLLTLSPEAMARRGGFGEERYEVPALQKKVMDVYLQIKDDSFWQVIDADKTEESLGKQLENIIINTINSITTEKIETLDF